MRNNHQINLGIIFFVLACLIGINSACIKPEQYPREPQITTVALSSDSIHQFENVNNFTPEPFSLTVGFEDGDGDLGITTDYPQANAFVRDSRTGYIDSLEIPYMSPAGNIKSISGTIEFTFPSECCIALSGITCSPDAVYNPVDTVVYEVFIKDRAGNISNIVKADPLYIICP